MGFFKDMWKKVDNLEETMGVKAINRKMDEFFKKVEESFKKLKARFSVKNGTTANTVLAATTSELQAHTARKRDNVQGTASMNEKTQEHNMTQGSSYVMPITREAALARVAKAKARQSEMQGGADYADTTRNHKTKEKPSNMQDGADIARKQPTKLLMPKRGRDY
ncbi:MAG: hypothetical protein IJW75_02700 [Alphaproteobacteria bacterium]|nr:hypothetical protein [Alphaproteobacteria bacterium]